MEDDLNFSIIEEKWKSTSIIEEKWKSTSIFSKMEDNLNFLGKGRQSKFFGKWKTI
jgi:hypothetical protein